MTEIKNDLNYLNRYDSNKTNTLLDKKLTGASAYSVLNTAPGSPLTFVKHEHLGLMLDNLYKPTTSSNYLRQSNYEMSDLGEYVAGNSGKISLKELNALDKNNNGKISQEEYNIAKGEMNRPKPSEPKTINVTDNFAGGFNSVDVYGNKDKSSLGNGFLENELTDASAKTWICYFNQNDSDYPDINLNKQTDLILDNLYTPTSEKRGETETCNYKMNDLGKYIAGKDGKISLNELSALDKNNDNKLSQEEYSVAEDKMQQSKQPKMPAQDMMQKMMQYMMMMMQMMMQIIFGGVRQQPQQNVPRFF